MSIVKTGQNLTFTAPVGGVTVDVPVLIGGLLVVPQVSADAGDRFDGYLWGLYKEAPKATGETWSEGEALYFDESEVEFTTDDSAGPLVGSAAEDAGSSDATGSIVLGGPLAVAAMSQAYANGAFTRQLRARYSAAEVDAAATDIIAAVPGYKIRLLDSWMIAIGGAAAGVTTVDIVGTQSASPVKLVAYGQAALTENTMVRAGSSGGVILAGGVSFVANDENTPVTLGNTGNALTTATHVDVMLLYALDAA